jgi:hypothetical protein
MAAEESSPETYIVNGLFHRNNTDWQMFWQLSVLAIDNVVGAASDAPSDGRASRIAAVSTECAASQTAGLAT